MCSWAHCAQVLSFSLQSQLWLQRAETYARTRWNPGLDQPDKLTGYLPALPQNAFCYIKMISFDLAELNPIIVVIVKCSSGGGSSVWAWRGRPLRNIIVGKSDLVFSWKVLDSAQKSRSQENIFEEGFFKFIMLDFPCIIPIQCEMPAKVLFFL